MATEAGGATRVVIVDDHPVVRHGLADLIDAESDLEVCGEAAGVRDALELVVERGPDVAIVDISLEDGSGLDLIERLLEVLPELKVLVTSMYDEFLYAERAVHAGALGYVQKREAARTIVSAVRRVAGGRLALSEHVSEKLVGRIARGESQAERSPLDRLSARELEVFRQIGLGHTVQEIAYTLGLSAKTIETYRDRLRKKLGIPSSARLVRYAFEWSQERPR